MKVYGDDIGDPCGRYSGQGARALQQTFLKLPSLSAVIALQPQIERHLNRALWIDEVNDPTQFPRAPLAQRIGLRSALAFPIGESHEGEPEGVVELFKDSTDIEHVFVPGRYVASVRTRFKTLPDVIFEVRGSGEPPVLLATD